MCGRYSLTKSVDALRQMFRFEERPNLAPRYNVAPGTAVAAVRIATDGRRHLELFEWGIARPGWRPGRRSINAKTENLRTTWREPFHSRRCLVLADGFYEWQKGTTPKQPWRFVLADGAPFAMAGIYESTPGQVINTLAVVTTTANTTVARLHDRMPVVLEDQAADRWLDPDAAPDALLPLTAPLPAVRMRGYPVDPRMNAPAFDDPGCAEPWSEEPAQPKLL
jgi:putative SOS response-associated peptidase YedK